MLQSLMFSLNAVVPLFLLGALGYILHAKNILPDSAAAVMKSILFKIAMPCTLFLNASTANMKSIFSPTLLLLALAATAGMFAVYWAIGTLLIKDGKKRGSFVQATARGNYGILGSVVIAAMYGTSSGVMELVAMVSIPAYAVCSVIVLSVCAQSGKRVNVGGVLLNIVKNPFIISLVLGTALSLLEIKLPLMLTTTIKYLGQLTSPVAFITLGAGLTLKSLVTRYTLGSAFLKLIVTPLIFIPFGVLFGIRGEALMVLFILTASPSAVASYTMAVGMGCDAEIAAGCVGFSTVAMVATFTVGISVLKALALI